MCFRDIAAFVLQHAAFPTPPLVASKFPHVPLGVGGWPLGYELSVKLVSKISNRVGAVKRFFPQACVSAVQGHPRSLILAPIESAYATSYWSVIET